jgi:hypothetical protein
MAMEQGYYKDSFVPGYMPTSRTNKILTAIVVVALIAAIGVLVFSYIPWNGFPENQTTPLNNATITIISQNRTVNITLKKITELGEFHGAGGYRSQTGAKGVGNYSGITIKQLLNVTLGLNESRYSLNITSGDGKWTTFDREEAKGNVSIYSSENTTNPIAFGDVDLVLIYSYNGQPLTGSDGPFRIGYLNTKVLQPPITNSTYWLKDARTIQVLT